MIATGLAYYIRVGFALRVPKTKIVCYRYIIIIYCGFPHNIVFQCFGVI